MNKQLYNRRGFLGSAAFATALFGVRGAFADVLTRTPPQTEGPFYPNKLPLDTDNDLIIVNDGITPAIGEITHLTGRVLTPSGSGLNNLVVEIWQVDGNGAYLHSGTANAARRDRNFQGFGRFTTNQRGEYRFRTVKPVLYSGRAAPHIHFKVKKGRKDLLTTQCYIKGYAGNERDGVYRGIRDEKGRAAVTIDFTAIKDSKIGELAAKFDIVLGVTPSDA